MISPKLILYICYNLKTKVENISLSEMSVGATKKKIWKWRKILKKQVNLCEDPEQAENE